jgi:hypothetical protein
MELGSGLSFQFPAQQQSAMIEVSQPHHITILIDQYSTVSPTHGIEYDHSLSFPVPHANPSTSVSSYPSLPNNYTSSQYSFSMPYRPLSSTDIASYDSTVRMPIDAYTMDCSPLPATALSYENVDNHEEAERMLIPNTSSSNASDSLIATENSGEEDDSSDDSDYIPSSAYPEETKLKVKVANRKDRPPKPGSHMRRVPCLIPNCKATICREGDLPRHIVSRHRGLALLFVTPEFIRKHDAERTCSRCGMMTSRGDAGTRHSANNCPRTNRKFSPYTKKKPSGNRRPRLLPKQIQEDNWARYKASLGP